MVWVPFPLTSTPEPIADTLVGSAEVYGMMLIAVFVWMLPRLLINKRLCCRCCTNWMSRRMGTCFCIGLIINLTLVSIVIAAVPGISANDLFFAFVEVVGQLAVNAEDALEGIAVLVALVVAWLFRHKFFALLGFDQQLIRADPRDLLTCFTMHRFMVIEVSILKVQGLPEGMTSRSMYMRVLLGYNEAQHTRAHDKSNSSMTLKERFQLNYDPVDEAQQLSIVVKKQEILSHAVSQLAPIAGAVSGFLGGTITGLGGPAGAGVGVVTGIGAANAVGEEIARVDLSCAMINRLRTASKSISRDAAWGTSTSPAVPWREEHYTKVDLVPQGECWLRITDVEQA